MALDRRSFLAAGLALPLVAAGSGRPGESAFRIGLTPVFLDNQIDFLKRWRAYLERQLQAPVYFVQRASYQEITDLLMRGELDLAWLCGYPYALNADRMRLLAVPLFENRPRYRSYIVVWDEDRSSKTLSDLEGSIFAYSDPLSNSGYLFPQYVLSMLGYRPDTFFRRSFFTWSHRGVIEAVAAGLAQAGAVDGFVWEMFARQRPEIAAHARVIERSPEFAFPPLVVGTQLSLSRQARLADLFLGMHGDPEGRVVLKELGLTGFVPGQPGDYDEMLSMARELQRV